MSNPAPNFYQRHEFLIRRLHSLSGLIPVGGFMIVHLLANASIMNGPKAFQNIVYQIHSLGSILPLVEWVFIFLPILFHGVVGFYIIYGGKSNVSNYPTSSNVRYSLQRITGMIAFVFIAYHVLHMHGMIHIEAWQSYASDALGLAQFAPYNAASTAASAMQSNLLVPAVYLFGIAACVFHFANGLWTMGITWGVWTTPKAQQRASWICSAIGIGLMLVAVSAVVGFYKTDVQAAEKLETEMYQERVKDGSILENPEKLTESAREAVGDE